MKSPIDKLFIVPAVLITAFLAACATAPPVETSWNNLWQQFSNKSIDNLFMAWGAPNSETRLTNGTRLVSYSYSDIYDYNEWDRAIYGCKATFLAPPPKFKIAKITLDGSDYECYQLSLGHLGVNTTIAPENQHAFYGMYRDYWR